MGRLIPVFLSQVRLFKKSGTAQGGEQDKGEAWDSQKAEKVKLMPNSSTLCFFFGLPSSPFKDTLAAETQWREPEGSSLVAQGTEQNVPSGVGSPGAVKTPLTVALKRRLYLRGPFPPLKILKVIFSAVLA